MARIIDFEWLLGFNDFELSFIKYKERNGGNYGTR